MNDVTIIDQFLNTFAAYIDSGFGLLRGEVAFLTATLIVIDMTIAGLYWAMSHATGQGEDVIASCCARCSTSVPSPTSSITSTGWPASCSARLRDWASPPPARPSRWRTSCSRAGWRKPASTPGRRFWSRSARWRAFEVFVNLDPIVVMFLAWLVVVLCFFVLAIQLFITLIEFKLTTLAGFVLVPFALWNKTAFLAEKVLGNVVASGVKVLVLAVIVGIGSGLFAQFQVHPAEPSIDHALVIMLASLTLLALGIFGPGIATGLVSGAPQLGAGAMAGAAVGAAGTAVAIGAAATGVGGAVAAGARMAPAAAKLAGSGARHVGGQQCEVGVPGRFRRRWRRQQTRWRAWATSPRPARRQPGVLHPALPLPGNAWPLLPRWLEWRCCRWRRGCGIRSGAAGGAASGAATAQTGTTRLGQAPASPPATHPRRDHHRPRAARWRWRRLRQGPSLRDSDS